MAEPATPGHGGAAPAALESTPDDVQAKVAQITQSMSMSGTVGVMMKVRGLGSKLKTKAAGRKNKLAMRQIFVGYAEAFGQKAAEAEVIRAAFDKIDADKSGFIDGDELKMIGRELGVPMSKSDIDAALKIMDENGDNEIEFEEFRDWWVLQGSSGEGSSGPMAIFKKQLMESVSRGKMQFDYDTFAQLCRECNLLGKMLKSRAVKPAGALLEDRIQYAFRMAMDPEWDAAAAEVAEAEMRAQRVKSKKEEAALRQQLEVWKHELMDFEKFFSAIEIVASEMFEKDPDPIVQVDKLIRRIEQSGGSRAAKWVDRAEKAFGELDYANALQSLDKAIKLDDSSCQFFSARAATHAAMQDWNAALADACTTIDLVDRYEGGQLSQDELVSLASFKDLGEAFYTPPTWLQGQLREYELRKKDEEVAAQVAAAAAPQNSEDSARRTEEMKAKEAAEAAKAQRRASTRPEVDAVIAGLHGSVKKAAFTKGSVPMLEYAASLLDDYHQAGPNDKRSSSFLTESFGKAFGVLAGLPEGEAVSELTGADMLKCMEEAGATLSKEEEWRVLEQLGMEPNERHKTIPLQKLVSVTNDHSRPFSALRARSWEPPKPEPPKPE